MKYRHFGKINQKKALLRGLVLSILKNEGINTFEGRAKDAQRMVEEVIREARKDNLAGRRRIAKLLAGDREIVSQIYDKVLPSLEGRTSGFTRIIHLGRRKGDGTSMARLEWVVALKKAKKEEQVKVPKVPNVSKISKRSKGRGEASLPAGSA